MRIVALLFFCAVSVFGQAVDTLAPAFTQSTSPLRVGLAGYWRLEEASGTRYDFSKNGNHLTANNSPGQATGKVGNCAGFVASSTQYLSAGNTNSFQFTTATPFSVTCWVKLTNNSTYQIVCSKEGPAFTGWWFGAFNDNKLYFTLEQSGGGALSKKGTTTIVDSAWHFICATYDGSVSTNGIKLYVDGSLETATAATSGSPTISNSSPFNIGRRDTSSAQFYSNGLIDEPGIWSLVLSATGTGSIAQLYASGLGTHFPWSHP